MPVAGGLKMHAPVLGVPMLGVLAAAVLSTSATAAPSGLYGKSVTVSWTESRSQRDVGEQAFKPVSIPFTLIVYVSSEGRPFHRITSTSPRGATGSKERVSGSGASSQGAFSLQFQGNTLVSSRSNGGYGLHIQVSFDSGFTSCTAQVVAARQTGAKSVMLRSIASGMTVEVESLSAGSASCSISQGNAFAQ
jgi:hypothetical protein